MENEFERQWQKYVAAERERVMPFLSTHGFTLDEHQPQTIGERFLTRPVGGGRKIVFFGRRISDEMRVVIKTSSEQHGIEELEWEHRAHTLLTQIKFAYQSLFLPEEIIFVRQNGILITEYIEQDKPFVERPLKEQFDIALQAFKAQESAHATTATHWSSLKKLMGKHAFFIKAGEYKKIADYVNDILSLMSNDHEISAKLEPLIDKVIVLIGAHEETLERYSGFLTHWDFTPQNFRIRGGKLYLLDHTSIRFGNKYEGWARFINFMELYNPPLARALVQYVRDNRTSEESLSLKLMRAYRLIELIRYYASWLPNTAGNLNLLARARIQFWNEVLSCVLNDTAVPHSTVEEYKKIRDNLRSEKEKERQIGLH